jgi:molybdopterin synthase catalytic subunit
MIRIVSQTIDKNSVIDAVADPGAGALVTFDGRVRNQARGKRVVSLFYEAYEEMALRQMEEIQSEALTQWPHSKIAIVHRVGHLEIGESSIFLAVSSAHRREAFEACQFLIDTIKVRVPIWKKELYEDGEVWVDSPNS